MTATALHLRASDYAVAAIADHAEAVAAIEAWHYSESAPNTSTYRHGLFSRSHWPMFGSLLGVALWIPPTKNAAASVARDDWQGVLCLSRLVVDPELPTNGASFLLGNSMKAIDRKRWPVLLTYADTLQGHTGAIYRATNWTELGPVPAGDTWLGPDGKQRGRKRGGRTLRVEEMRALGFVKQPQAPKIKFVHDVRRAA